MPRRIFVDTSAWIAVYHFRDQAHEAAVDYMEELLEENCALVTSTDVFDETVTMMLKRAGHAAAMGVGRQLLDASQVFMVQVDEETRHRAWTDFQARTAKPMSLTDCTSVAVMAAHKIRDVFTFDDDFRGAGCLRRP